MALVALFFSHELQFNIYSINIQCKRQTLFYITINLHKLKLFVDMLLTYILHNM